MGVSFYVCGSCGDTFCDAGHYMCCDACGYKIGPCCCDNLRYKEEQEDGEWYETEIIEDCPGCAGELTTTYYLTPCDFKVFKTRDEAEKNSAYVVLIEVPN